MSLLARLLGQTRDDRDAARPLWHRVVEIAREKEWYATCGVADSVPGRFDMITLVLSLVLLRMEREEALIQPSVWLTELFVDDMDGQLRESGVGDLVVGKHIGKLMGTLGGRLGAYREGLEAGEEVFAAALARNKRTTLVGEPTAGLAAVQRLVKLPEGHGLWMTYARYLKADDQPLHEQGLMPDDPVDIPVTPFDAPAPAPNAVDPLLSHAVKAFEIWKGK